MNVKLCIYIKVLFTLHRELWNTLSACFQSTQGKVRSTFLSLVGSNSGYMIRMDGNIILFYKNF